MYLFFASLFFISGVFINSKNAIKTFYIVALAFPFTNITNKVHVLYQIPVFLFFVLGGIVKKKYNKVSFNKEELLLVFLYVIFFAYCFFSVLIQNQSSVINFFKDIKFALFSLLLLFFIKLNRPFFRTSFKFFQEAIKWNFLISFVVYILMKFFRVHELINSDQYFFINEIRYMNYGFYILPFYILHVVSNKIKLKPKDWLYVIFPMIISGNRTILILTILILLILFLKTLSNRKILSFIFIFFTLLGSISVLINRSGENSPLYRYKKLISFDYLVQIINTRLSPFLIGIEDFTIYNYIFGKGIGSVFYIPWFHYRENLDNYNIYMDSLYPTLYLKYGIFMILPIVIFFLLLKTLSEKKIFNYLFLYFFILGLTNSFMYQNNIIIILFIIYLLSFQKRNTIRNENSSHSLSITA